MKKMLFLLLILFMPVVFSATMEYTIVEEKTLVEIEMDIGEVEIFEFPENFEYSENKIKYLDKGLIEKSEKNYFFILKSELLPNSSVKVVLSEGTYLNENYIIFPKNYILSTNGQNIILEWNKSGEKEILISYFKKQNNYLFLIPIIFLFLIGFYVLFKKKILKEKYSQNLIKEEKDIMKFLLKRKNCWTKELVKDLKISKVKLSRKLRNLEEKGLIERIPYGNENKIKIK